MANKTRRNKNKRTRGEAKQQQQQQQQQQDSTIPLDVDEEISGLMAHELQPTAVQLPPAEEKEGGLVANSLKVMSSILERFRLASLGALQFGGARDLYDVFGYKKKLTADDFHAKYVRQDITSRIIDAPPGATWSDPPKFKDSEAVQAAWDELVKKVKLWNVMYRADRLARLGHYSIILFGFNDASSLSSPLNPGKVTELLYARPLGSRMIKEITFNSNQNDPRFGLPKMYEIEFDVPDGKKIIKDSVTTRGLGEIKVHASRVVHIVENPLEDEVFGIPIIERIYNLLDDLLKVAGGTSEMYWLSARQGLHADIDKEMDLDPDDQAALAEEFEDFHHQLNRTLKTRGVSVKDLGSSPPSPKDTFEMLLAMISGTTGIPRRILLGSEVGQLASEQDRANWAERISERRDLFAEPTMLRPILELFQEVGLVPEGEPEIEWPSAFKESPLEKSMDMAQRARAIGNISRQTGNQAPMQLTSREEARDIIGLEGDLDEKDIIEPPEPPKPSGGFGGEDPKPKAKKEEKPGAT